MIMKNRSAVFLLALLGVISSGRLTDAQPPAHSSGSSLPTDNGVPPIDAAVPHRLETATFALG
jgi:hypothetical protein